MNETDYFNLMGRIAATAKLVELVKLRIVVRDNSEGDTRAKLLARIEEQEGLIRAGKLPNDPRVVNRFISKPGEMVFVPREEPPIE